MRKIVDNVWILASVVLQIAGVNFGGPICQTMDLKDQIIHEKDT